jgi:ElaB/YqjD/DUF883 family membrane-anchored ribosome-binding protein
MRRVKEEAAKEGFRITQSQSPALHSHFVEMEGNTEDILNICFDACEEEKRDIKEKYTAIVRRLREDIQILNDEISEMLRQEIEDAEKYSRLQAITIDIMRKYQELSESP